MTAARGTGGSRTRTPALPPVSGPNTPSLGLPGVDPAPRPADGRTEPQSPAVCRCCGRPLRSEWAAREIGPVCARKAGHRPAPHIPTPLPEHHVDGQEELPLIHLQPTLWSL